MELNINKLKDTKIYPTYYLNVHCYITNNNVTKVDLNYNSSFDFFIENKEQKTYFISDKIETSKQTVKTILKSQKFTPKDIQKSIW